MLQVLLLRHWQEYKLPVPTEPCGQCEEDAVVIFMLDIAKYYQLSPDNEFVFLPFPKRAVVHSIYTDQVEAKDDACTAA